MSRGGPQHLQQIHEQHQGRRGAYMATPADRMHTAAGLSARSSNQQRGRGVYVSCLWPTMQYWGFLEGARDFKARNTAKEHTNEVQSGVRDPGVSRPGACLGQSPVASRQRCAESVGSCHPDRLRLAKMVEQGPHGRTRTSSWLSFDNATWHGDTVLRMHWQAVPAPWALHSFPRFLSSLEK